MGEGEVWEVVCGSSGVWSSIVGCVRRGGEDGFTARGRGGREREVGWRFGTGFSAATEESGLVERASGFELGWSEEVDPDGAAAGRGDAARARGARVVGVQARRSATAARRFSARSVVVVTTAMSSLSAMVWAWRCLRWRQVVAKGRRGEGGGLEGREPDWRVEVPGAEVAGSWFRGLGWVGWTTIWSMYGVFLGVQGVL